MGRRWSNNSSSSISSCRLPNASWFLFVFVLFGGPDAGHNHFLANAAPKRRREGHASSRNVSFYNKAATKIDIFWIHPTTGELAPSNTNGDGIVFGAMSGVNSYVGHKFEVQEIPNPATGACKNKNACRKAYFECSAQENQVVEILSDENGNFVVTYDDDKLKAEREAKRVLEPCQIDTTTTTTSTTTDANAKIAALAACWQKQANAKLDATKDEIAFQQNLRKQLGVKLQSYKCDRTWNAVNVTTSHSIHNSTYGNGNKQVELLFESDHSSVRLYRDFLTLDECKAIMIGQTAAASDSALQKIRDLVSAMLLNDPYKSSMKSIRVRLDGNADQECTMQADGTCLQDDAAISLMRVTQTENTIDARLLVTCTSDANAEGGLLFYPKAGVQIVPVSGEAVFTMYKDRRGGRDADPFVDDHVVCPVQKGVVLTLEDTFYSQ